MGDVNLSALLDRVDGATGASRVLDFELHTALVEDAVWPSTDMRGRITNPNSRMSDYLETYRDVIDADDQDFDFPRYTASVDAALALIGRVLPGWTWDAGSESNLNGTFYTAILWTPNAKRDSGEHVAKSPALALCTALLSALSRARGE